ncbi:hypothetical protein [Roseomonas indoligenes]|uniref:Flagellar FliJ protein n=1 Tax=Roseomonas indoligenes TaxID=2820811 RepID=A0A940MU55_9PROT|nr:hypothetical protein [Pararoseomonas indoligenes]MBP0492021.1 hypothetical protein [Pararoseomonas indoligenes]
MRRDPLAVLARLRGAAVMEARRRVSEAALARALAEAGVAEAGAALRREADIGGPDHAVWLPRGLAARDSAEAGVRSAAARAEEAAVGLGAARAAERAVEELAALRDAEARRKALRAEGRLLDEAGASRARPVPG